MLEMAIIRRKLSLCRITYITVIPDVAFTAYSARRSNPCKSTMSSTLVMESQHREEKRIWYRSTLFNAFVIGAVGFLAPGLWNAMSSLGAGGAESPFLVNAANALVFGLSKPRSSTIKERER